MKSFIGSILAVMMVVSVACAGEFGPPEPTAAPGKFSFGLGYWFDQSSMKLDSNHLLGTMTSKSNQYYMQGTYTFLKDWEVYGRFGGADEKLDTDVRNYSDSAEPYGTLGFKGLAYQYKSFGIGPFVQGNWYGDHTGVMKNQWDLNLGISAQYKVPVGGCNLTVYGGPFAYWHQADSLLPSHSLYGPQVASGLPLNAFSLQDDMKQKNNVGGFLGVKFPIVKEKIFFTAEGQLTNNVGAGASIAYTF
jgi:hypothetical protein